MFTPGAKTLIPDPQLEKLALPQYVLMAPTVMALAAEAGELLAQSWFSLPAATTEIAPEVTPALTAVLMALERLPSDC